MDQLKDDTKRPDGRQEEGRDKELNKTAVLCPAGGPGTRASRDQGPKSNDNKNKSTGSQKQTYVQKSVMRLSD